MYDKDSKQRSNEGSESKLQDELNVDFRSCLDHGLIIYDVWFTNEDSIYNFLWEPGVNGNRYQIQRFGFESRRLQLLMRSSALQGQVAQSVEHRTEILEPQSALGWLKEIQFYAARGG